MRLLSQNSDNSSNNNNNTTNSNQPPTEENQPDPETLNLSRRVRSYYIGRQLNSMISRNQGNFIQLMSLSLQVQEIVEIKQPLTMKKNNEPLSQMMIIKLSISHIQQLPPLFCHQVIQLSGKK